MKEAYKSVTCRNLLHDLHCQLVVIGGNVCCGINGCQLVLSGCNLVMLCFCKDAKFPEFIVQIFHESLNTGLDNTEVMVVKFLSLGRLCSEKCPAGKTKVGTLLVHFPGNKEVFLLGSYRRNNSLCSSVSEKAKDPECLFAQHFHGTKKRSLLVQRMSAVGAECRGNAE